MRGIAKLLFGDDADRLLGLFGEGGGDGFDLAERARRSGEWCGSTPPGRGGPVARAPRAAADRKPGFPGRR
jgi:hypothetical protein